MRSIEIPNWKQDQTISAIVKATFPDYRRKTVYIDASETVTLHDLNWSGGTRAEYRACTMQGVELGNTARFSRCAPWNNPAEGATLPIPAGTIVVRGGHFCGKVSALRLYVNPADMPKYLPRA